jgi:DNA-binding transcriptional MocR family regulator
MTPNNWTPRISNSGRPFYRELADAIAIDIEAGRLRPGDRLPPQRQLAQVLEVDLTTVSRGYAEAQTRGLIQSAVGRGTFVAPRAVAGSLADPTRRSDVDLTMNLPPEPADPSLIARMQEGMAAVAGDLTSLLRYQSPAGSEIDRQAARVWLSERGIDCELDRIIITPGANATIFGILAAITRGGGIILSERITYPGAQAIARRAGCRLVGVEEDAEGIDPAALDCSIREHLPRALYLNPTLNNPTTRTLSPSRRSEIAGVLRKHDLPVIEDDAYGFLPASAPAPISSIVPELSWHIGGLAKVFGGGLRLAFTVAPNARSTYGLAQTLKTIAVMPPMLSVGLMTQWIRDGTANAVRDFVRQESAARQAIAAEVLEGFDADGDTAALNVWLRLPEGIGRADVVARMQGTQVGILPSDPFVVGGERPEAVRICLGGPITRDELRAGLSRLANTLGMGYWHG